MQKSLSRSFANEFGNQYDELLQTRVKHLLTKSENYRSLWYNEGWDIQFMGTIKMIQGADESAMVEKSGIVIKKLESTPLAGKLTLSLLPKFKSKDLSPIMDNILLRSSNMKYYPITNLNLTGTQFNCSMMKILVNTILNHSKYPYLNWLNFTQCGLTTKIKKRKNKDKLKEEKHTDQLYGLDVCSILSIGLQKNKSLQYLFLSKNPSIDANGLQIILQSITKHPSLRLLIYNSNQFTINHAKVLSQWLSRNPTLPRISMEHCNISNEMFIEITNGLSKNSKIFELGLGKNMISDLGMAAFCQKVLMNPLTNIMRLILFDNNITINGCKYLSEALSINWTITELNLSNQLDNNFDDECVNLLCDGLKNNESLHTLRIGNNSLTSQCCYGLQQLLQYHQNLNKLEVFYNKQIGEQGFQYLSKGLENNSRLKILNMSETSPGKVGANALKHSLLKQYRNTRKLIQETTKCLRQCIDAYKLDDVFSNDLVNEIVTSFVGYSSLKQLDLKNCYPNLLEPGVLKLIQLRDVLMAEGHELVIAM